MRGPEQIKPKSMEPRRNSFFIPGADAYDVDVSASTLGRFRSHSTQNVYQRVLTTWGLSGTVSAHRCRAEIRNAP